MNIIELQDSLKDLPDSALMREMQMPSGTAPQFLVLSELKRRKRMRDDFQRRQNADMKTVAEEVVTAAGAPQEGIMQVSRAMNPESSIAQNTGMDTAVQMPATQAPQPEQPMMMADGGEVRYMREGSFLSRLLGFGSDERNPDVGRPVEPFPANSPNPRDRSNWMAMYKDTHNLDGSPKSLSPDVADTEGVSALSANIEDYMAPGIDMQTQDALSGAMGSPDRDVRSGIAALTPPVAAGSFDAISPALDIDAQMGTQRIGIGTDPSIRDTLPESVRNDDLRFSRGTASSTAPSAGSDQIADMIAGSEISRLSGAIPLADAVSEMSGNAPIDFDASTPVNTRQDRAVDTPAYKNLQDIIRERMDIADRSRASSTADEINEMIEESISPSEVELMRREARTTGMVRPDVDFADPTMVPDPDFRVDEITQEKVDLTPALLDSLPGVVSGKTPNEKSSEVANFLRSIPVADEFTGTGSSSEGVDVGIPMPNESQPTIDVTVPDQVEQEPTVEDVLPLPVTTSGIEEFVEQEKLRGFGTPTVDGDGGGDGGDDKPTPPTTPRGGAEFGSIESRIEKMLADREKSAEADKWLALAQTGMALMASKNPTFGGALGEAGLLGVGAMQKARQQYDDDILGLLGMQQKIQTAKAAAAKAALPKGLSASEKNKFLGEAGDLFEKIQELNAVIGSGSEVINNIPYPLSEERIAALTAQRNALQSQYNKYIGLVNPQLANIQTAQ